MKSPGLNGQEVHRNKELKKEASSHFSLTCCGLLGRHQILEIHKTKNSTGLLALIKGRPPSFLQGREKC